MSKQIVVESFCDNVYQHGDLRVTATGEHTFKIDDAAPVVVDLCEGCTGLILPPLARLLANGSPVEEEQERPRRRRRGHNLPTTCPECGFESVSRGGLSHHLRFRHDKAVSDYPNGLKSKADYPAPPPVQSGPPVVSDSDPMRGSVG